MGGQLCADGTATPEGNPCCKGRRAIVLSGRTQLTSENVYFAIRTHLQTELFKVDPQASHMVSLFLALKVQKR